MKKLLIYPFLFLTLMQNGISQSIYDSLLIQRNNQYNEYNRFKESMSERTWINLLNLNKMALEVIATDNYIIEQHYPNIILRNRQLRDENEETKLEVALIEKETEMQKMILDDQRDLNKILLIVIGIAAIMFLLILILFIDRQTRYRSSKIELERMWSMKEDYPANIEHEEFSTLQNDMDKISVEKEQLEESLRKVTSQKSAVEDKLRRELSSRKDAEKELRELISQFKEG